MRLVKPAGLSALALLAMTLPASAATFTVEVSGWCASNCLAVGLAQDEAFAGIVDIDNANFDAGQFDSSAVSNFSFAFGSFALSDIGAIRSNNLVRWGDTPDAVSEIYIFAFGSDDPTAPGPFLSLSPNAASLGTGNAALDAFYAVDANGQWAGSEGNRAQFNTNILTSAPGTPVPVPLPAAGWLLGGALLGLAALRRSARS